MLELADAVVVGGGILGAAVTAALSRRFSKVLLVEADRCGGRATASGFAWVNASSKWTDRTYHALNAEAAAAHLALAAEWGAARTGWNGGGSLRWVPRSDVSRFAEMSRQLEVLQSWDIPVARLSRGEMQALEPNVQFAEDAEGLFAPSEGWINTARLIRFYLDLARERHAVIAEFTRVTGFTVDHYGAVSSVETDRARVSTRIVVLCAGTESGRLLGSAPHLAPAAAARVVGQQPGLLVELAPVDPGARIHRVCYPPSGHGLHMRPTPEGGILMGADDTDRLCGDGSSPAGTAPASAAEMAGAAAQLLKRAAPVLPQLGQETAMSTRCCVRPIPPDGLPAAGEIPGVPGGYLLVSHSGVTLGPLLGELLADEIITGRKSPWLAPYRPARLFA
jgi:glycine/D-amino acid oxidase-like deaminating enzyme